MELGEGSRFTSDELGHESYFSVSPLIQELSETGIQAVDPARKAGV
jgi:hypothetical protein